LAIAIDFQLGPHTLPELIRILSELDARSDNKAEPGRGGQFGYRVLQGVRNAEAAQTRRAGSCKTINKTQAHSRLPRRVYAYTSPNGVAPKTSAPRRARPDRGGKASGGKATLHN